MGVIYRGEDERLARPVAVKVLRPELCEERYRQRFLKEARAVAAVQHPGICQIYDVGEEDNTLFLVMELLEGEDLATRLRRGALPALEARGLVLEVLAALEALHQSRIIHRDLKPSNLFLTSHGVKVLDFGLARVIGPAGDGEMMAALTLPGVVVGTPNYLAPECIRGEEADSSSDLYALGVVLYEMLSGRRAFQGETPVDVMHAVLHKPPEPLEGSPLISELSRIIGRAMAPRADRYRSAAEFSEDLRNVLKEGSAVDGTVLRSEAPVVQEGTSVRRLIVLPFRVLPPGQQYKHLGSSLPEALSAAFTKVDNVSVRSSLVGVKFTQEHFDLERVAREAGVDVVLTGTLLCGKSGIGLNAQLIAVPGGTLVAAATMQFPGKDAWTLQDQIVTAVVRELTPSLSATATKAPGKADGDAGETLQPLLLALRDAPGSLQVLAGLVEACRLAGLLEESLRAHEAARAADPNVTTSVCRTHFARGEYETALATSVGDIYVAALSLAMMNQNSEALVLLEQRAEPILGSGFALEQSLREFLQDIDPVPSIEEGLAQDAFGPEEMFFAARQLFRAGEPGGGLRRLGESIEKGFACIPVLYNDPWLTTVRDTPEYLLLLREAEQRHQRAEEILRTHGVGTVLTSNTLQEVAI